MTIVTYTEFAKDAAHMFERAVESTYKDLLEKAVAEAVAAEREACAEVCEAAAKKMDDEGEGPTGYIGWVIECAAAIRARGDQ